MILSQEALGKMNSDNEEELFEALYEDLRDDIEEFRPLLAHYTSIENLENIVRSSELWLSHPLVMNDSEEVTFGVIFGVEAFERNEKLADVLGFDNRRLQLLRGVREAAQHYYANDLFDTYVLCLSQHDPSDRDGRLSMWRGYGGRGSGAAIVFDTSKIEINPASPLIIAKVEYATAAERLQWLDDLVSKIVEFMRGKILSDDDLAEIGKIAFERIKLAAIFSKHSGFSEELEWRVVYMPERDPEGLMKPYLHYHNSHRGFEPKLRLKVEPKNGVMSGEMSLEKLVDRIIIGPSRVLPVTYGSIVRMLTQAGKPQLADRLMVSGIPFRGE